MNSATAGIAGATSSYRGAYESELTFVGHSALPLPLSIRLASLQGHLATHPLSVLLDNPALKHTGAEQSLPPDLYCIIQLWAHNKQLVPPIQSSHKSFKLPSNFQWNERLELPIRLRDLPKSAQLAITVYDIAGPNEVAIVGGTTLRLFGKKSTLKKGKQRCFLWKGKQADGSEESETPSKVASALAGSGGDEMGRLEKLVKKHERGDITRMDWLDKLAFRQIEKIHAAESSKSDNLFLYIDMPSFDFPVVFSEPEYPLPTLPSLLPSTSSAPSTATPALSLTSPTEPPLFTILDPEIVRENPVEAKHRRLVRSHRNGPLDRELKPNAKIRDELNEILSYPPTLPLTSAQRDLLWSFRFYLTRFPSGLTKFLRAVVWSDPGEVGQAVQVLLPMWAEVEMSDALELLGPGMGDREGRVRAFAVGMVARADDEELMLYLLQLVQALKFESPPPPSSASASNPTSPSSSALRNSRHVHHHHHHHSRQTTSQAQADLPTLADFLIERSARNPVLGNHFYWYIQVECQDPRTGSLFKDVKKKFERRVEELQQQDSSQSDRLDHLKRQTAFIARLSTLALELRQSKDARPKKVDKLRSTLHSSSSHLGSFAPIPLPLDARISITGIDPEKSSVFKSNLFPLRLHLLTTQYKEDGTSQAGDPYPVIFKNGDDLRQDQLVIQLFTLMDRLLRKENLDLKLMPYRVLATGAVDGMVQFVESKTLQDISNEFGGSLLGYLRAHAPDPGSVGTYGVRPEVLDTYVRSCAGYCVVTYLLGVGDRHLDNLLLSPDGHFFHVDFGYILGRDPKPFPPAVKVCKEMVDAMGGMNSPHYARFKSLCYTGFTSLRKNANLIINLVALMVDANIPDIKMEPDKAVGKVQDKFLLNLSEEEAIKAFEALLNETSYFTSVLDRIHSVAQYWRS